MAVTKWTGKVPAILPKCYLALVERSLVLMLLPISCRWSKQLSTTPAVVGHWTNILAYCLRRSIPVAKEAVEL